MATKEDILEQIVEEYLTHKGYFVRHNIKFLPRRDHPEFVLNQHSNHSDIDVIGYHPKLDGEQRVMVVSCKSWQGGFNPAVEIRAITDKKIARGREAWKSFRELASPIWSDAFMRAVVNATGTDRFTYVTAVAKLGGEKATWENHAPFRAAIGGNPITILTFHDMVQEIQTELTQTLASTEVGRMLQMFRAANMNLDVRDTPI
jgi:hypothetical protein